MIQFNLLPDVKLEFVKAQRIKHVVISASVIATGAAFVVFLLLFLSVHVVQQKIISGQTSDIKKYNSQLQATPDLAKILTIQNQLGALTGLHAGKPAAGRNFNFIQQLTPTTVALTDLTADYTTNTLSISGTSPSLDNVNTLTDTLKYTQYSNPDVIDKPAFSSVVLSQFTRTATTSTFIITASFDPIIFDNANEVSLTVPAGISTPSVIGQPAAKIFSNSTSTGN